MNYRPKQYYAVTRLTAEPVEAEQSGMNVYFRTPEGKLGQYNVLEDDHKDAIFKVKEALVANGDGLENRAVLAVIEGGKNGN